MATLEKRNQELMFETRTLNITREEANIIYNLNTIDRALKNVYFRNSDCYNTLKKRSREKERDIIDRLDNIINNNESSIFAVCRSVNINRQLAPFINNKVNNLELNNLTLYDLRINLLNHLMDTSVQNKDILESILNKVQRTLTWDNISEINNFYNLINLNFYRKICIGEVTKVSIVVD